MRCRPQGEQRGVGVSRVNQLADGLFEQRILPQQIRRMANMVTIVEIGRTPAAAQRGLGKILHPTLILMIGKPPMGVHLIAGAVCQVGPHGRDRVNLSRRNIPFHQRAGNHRPYLLFIVAVTIFLIEFIDQGVKRHGFPRRRNCLPNLGVGNGFKLGIVHHRQHGGGARQLLAEHFLQVRLTGLVRPRRVEQRQLPQVRIQTGEVHKFHLNHRNMFNRGVLRKRKLHAQRLRKPHQIVQAFQTMKDGLRAQVMFSERLTSFDALQQRIHVLVDFQTPRQLAAIFIAQFRLQLGNQGINGRNVQKMQHRLLLARRMADQRGQRRHRTIAVRQHFRAHNRINGGRFSRFHGTHNRQHHFEAGYFA